MGKGWVGCDVVEDLEDFEDSPLGGCVVFEGLLLSKRLVNRG